MGHSWPPWRATFQRARYAFGDVLRVNFCLRSNNNKYITLFAWRSTNIILVLEECVGKFLLRRDEGIFRAFLGSTQSQPTFAPDFIKTQRGENWLKHLQDNLRAMEKILCSHARASLLFY